MVSCLDWLHLTSFIISINGAHKPCVATPVNVTYKPYLGTLLDVTETLFATHAGAVHKPCLASPVDVSQAVWLPWYLSTTLVYQVPSPLCCKVPLQHTCSGRSPLVWIVNGPLLVPLLCCRVPLADEGVALYVPAGSVVWYFCIELV